MNSVIRNEGIGNDKGTTPKSLGLDMVSGVIRLHLAHLRLRDSRCSVSGVTLWMSMPVLGEQSVEGDRRNGAAASSISVFSLRDDVVCLVGGHHNVVERFAS